MLLKTVTGPETDEDRAIAMQCSCGTDEVSDEDEDLISDTNYHKIPAGVVSLIR